MSSYNPPHAASTSLSVDALNGAAAASIPDQVPSGGVRRARSLFWTLYTWVLVLSCLLMGAVMGIVLGWTARLFGDRLARVAHLCVATAYRAIIRVHATYHYTIVGLENLPQGGAIWCPNHQSHSDVVYLFGLPGQFKFIIKRELFFVPLFGAAMRAARYPAIRRGDPHSAREVLDACGEILRAGIPVLSFPEGTRSKNGELQRFQSGSARLAVAHGVPLVPMAVGGTADLLPRGTFLYPGRARIVIRIGEPISTAGCTERDVRALTKRLRAEVAKLRALAVADSFADLEAPQGVGESDTEISRS